MKKVLGFVAGLIFGLLALGFAGVTVTSISMLQDPNYYEATRRNLGFK